MVRTNTRFGPGASDAAVLRVKGTERGLALSTDGNGRWCWLSPRSGADARCGGSSAQCGVFRRATGGGDELPEFRQPGEAGGDVAVQRSVDGIAEACRALDIPITGGNVSFYNETLGKPIYPTPILGVLGVLEDADFAVGSAFDKEGDAIVLLDGFDAGILRAPLRMTSARGMAAERTESGRSSRRRNTRRRLTESSRACHRQLIWLLTSG